MHARRATVHARAGMLLCLHLLAAARVVKEPHGSEAFARVANKTAIRPIARMHAGVYVVAQRHATTPEAEEPICQLDKYSVGDRRRRNCNDVPSNCPVRCVRAGQPITCPDASAAIATPTASGGWTTSSSYVYLLDVPLAKAIAEFVGRDGTMVELGSGKGCYVSELRRQGVRRVQGYDFQAEPGGQLVSHADLGLANLQLPTADWALSLEVGEHIPKEHASAFVRNLHAHNRRGIILSWSDSKSGNGHVNPLSNAQVLALFDGLGYRIDAEATAMLRAAAGSTGIAWFKTTLQVLRRASRASEL